MPDADLTGRADVERLLRDFYGRAFADPLLGHVFVDVVQMDLEAHLPVLAAFWEKVLFDTGSYSGSAMAVHRRVHALVPLTEEHFSTWLRLWRESLRACFTGPVADQAEQHAQRMARSFLRSLPEPPRSLPITPTR